MVHDDVCYLRAGGGVHDKLHISSADCWDILLLLAQTPDRRERRILVSPPKDTGKVGQTELPKFRSEVAAAGFEPRTTRSPVKPIRPQVPGTSSALLWSMVYSSEAWSTTLTDRRRLEKLDVFDMHCQRRLMRVFWQRAQYVNSNRSIRERTKQSTASCLLRQRRLRWFGHLLCMTSSLLLHCSTGTTACCTTRDATCVNTSSASRWTVEAATVLPSCDHQTYQRRLRPKLSTLELPSSTLVIVW